MYLSLSSLMRWEFLEDFRMLPLIVERIFITVNTKNTKLRQSITPRGMLKNTNLDPVPET